MTKNRSVCACLQGVPAICAVHPASRHRSAASEADGSAVSVVVATAEGILYEYGISGLHSGNGSGSPTCALEQECFLLRSTLDN